MTRRSRLIFTYIVIAVAILCLGITDIGMGTVKIGSGEIIRCIFKPENGKVSSDIINLIRIPRILTATLAGACLALSGAQMQAVFRNQLADPHILGLSSGSGLGVALCTAAGFGIANTGAGIANPGNATDIATGLFNNQVFGTVVAAGAGAFVSALLISYISTRMKRSSNLLLAGVMLGFILSAMTSIIEYQADETSVKMYWNWAAGSFSGNTWDGVKIMAIMLPIGLIISISIHKGLTLMLFGEDFATASGSNTRRTTISAILSCCILTGTATAFCGPIGFVGIIAPHISRWTSGRSAMRDILPLSLMTGSAICLAGDILSQSLSTPLPVGSTTAIIGIPVIFYLISRYQE